MRCAVRITYTKNTTRGVWKAHGRYLARESATAEGKPNSSGFDPTGGELDVACQTPGVAGSKDELLWKFILSPEFGERADLPRLTRDLMKRIAEDLVKDLEWVNYDGRGEARTITLRKRLTPEVPHAAS
jgi:hypothetical protein